jgi:hypothetical protein
MDLFVITILPASKPPRPTLDRRSYVARPELGRSLPKGQREVKTSTMTTRNFVACKAQRSAPDQFEGGK